MWKTFQQLRKITGSQANSLRISTVQMRCLRGSIRRQQRFKETYKDSLIITFDKIYLEFMSVLLPFNGEGVESHSIKCWHFMQPRTIEKML